MDLKLKALDKLLQITGELGIEGGFDYKGFYQVLAKMRGGDRIIACSDGCAIMGTVRNVTESEEGKR